ncbi:MAG: NUDIX hydrolase [Pontiellaceae bacterium]|jgi:ADP-ribose pyrophosphatase|nr:NUDIX hydrolase [Pontiellaceae bacterium]
MNARDHPVKSKRWLQLRCLGQFRIIPIFGSAIIPLYAILFTQYVSRMYEKTLNTKTVFKGRILSVDVLEVELAGGRVGTREIIRHGVAVAVIARRRDGRFVFIRQFRKAMERVCFEVMAGNVDPDEAPEAAAVRELKEETGYEPDSIRLLAPIYPSVGYCTERIDIFYADVHEPGETDFDPDESIETVLVTESEMDGLIRSGQVQDAKTLAAWALHKSQIQVKCD